MPCALLDGTSNLAALGGNAVVAVSLATAIAAGNALGVPLYRMLAGSERPLLPLPMVNVISGGAHAAGGIDVQDLLVVPVGASSFSEAIEWAARVRTATASVAAERGLEARLVADEGGLGPAIASTEEALELLALGIARSGLRPGEDVGDRSRRRRDPARAGPRHVRLAEPGRRARRERARRPHRRLAPRVSRSSRSRIRSRTTTGAGGRRRRAGSTACSSSATTCS